MKKIILAASFLLSIIALPAFAQTSDYTGGRLSLSATGKVNIAPDLATLTAGVVTEAKTAREALSGNRVRMNRVFEALKQAGIKDRDMQTSGLNVSPIYAPYNSSQSRSEPRITGYRANNQVSAIVRDLDGLGTAIDALVESGANNIGGVSFGVEDQKSALDEARKQAMENLFDKARLYAQAGGFEIGDIINMSESGGYRPQTKFAYARMESMAMDSAPSPIAAGEVTSSITINAVFEIEQ